MRYIGNKINLLEFIEQPLKEKGITGTKFCDIFAGTANVAKHFKKNGYTIISNDNMMYSYVFQKAYIENNSTPNFSGLSKIIKDVNIDAVFAHLNELEGQKGFVYKSFCIEGSKNSKYERNYFTEENATKIDVMRDAIDAFKSQHEQGLIVLANHNNDKVQVLVGVTKSLTQNIKAGDVIKHLLAQIGGRGGGRPDFAQGGGEASREELQLAMDETEKYWVENMSK